MIKGLVLGVYEDTEAVVAVLAGCDGLYTQAGAIELPSLARRYISLDELQLYCTT